MPQPVTPTAVCNMALRRIGAMRIDNFETENSAAAQACRDVFHKNRRMTLALHTWNGAKRTTQLTENTSITPTFMANAFTLPGDYVRMISVHPSDDPNATVPYEFINDATYDLVLVTDADSCYIKYIFDNYDLTTMSPGFHDALSFMLARDLAQALNKSAAMAELGDRAMRRMLVIAKSLDGLDTYPQEMAQGSWIKSRFGLYSDKAIPSG